MEGAERLMREQARTAPFPHPASVLQSGLRASPSYKYLKNRARILFQVVILHWPCV